MNDHPVTRPDLDAIQTRADTATPAPWFVEHGRIHSGSIRQFDWVAVASMTGSRVWLPDAEFIAHARQDVPDLLVALAADRARADQAERDVTNAENYGIRWMKRAQEAEHRIADAPHAEDCLIGEWNEAAGHSMPCTCWKSAAPTTEQ